MFLFNRLGAPQVLDGLAVVASSIAPPVLIVYRVAASCVTPLLRLQLEYPGLDHSAVRICGLCLQRKVWGAAPCSISTRFIL